MIIVCILVGIPSLLSWMQKKALAFTKVCISDYVQMWFKRSDHKTCNLH